MESDHGLLEEVRKRDWRIWLGLVITFVWITAGTWFVVIVVSEDGGRALSLDTVGGFLEGAFAPLAFLWLVIGLFIQQRELARHADALRHSSEQSARQTQAIAATEMNARQETFFKIAENVKQQLSGISGMLFMSGLGPIGSGRFGREQVDEMFGKAANGDHAVFVRQFLTMDYLEEGGLPELLYGTEIRRRHTKNYRRTYERLLRLAEGCDVDGIIVDSMLQNAFGLFYQRMTLHAKSADVFDDGGLRDGLPTHADPS